ncbi:MAG TPA: hypothetical protein VMS77_01055 [Conexivisphaerales archaeon]|nr:hypothetical protein [Conexivisphaerales archaeon]
MPTDSSLSPAPATRAAAHLVWGGALENKRARSEFVSVRLSLSVGVSCAPFTLILPLTSMPLCASQDFAALRFEAM